MNFLFKTKPKVDPTEYDDIENQSLQPMEAQAFYYNETDFEEFPDFDIEQIIHFPKQNYNSWLNIHGIHETKKIVRIAKKLKLHHLSIQDIFDIHQRPKFQEFDTYFFFNIKSKFIEENKDLSTEQISFVLGENFLVSFQEKKNDHFQHLRERIRKNKGVIRERGADYLLFLMLEAILIEFDNMIENLQEEVENFQLMDVNVDPSPDLLKEIEYQKKKIQVIRKAIFPVKEFCTHVETYENPFIQETNLKYFKDVKEYCRSLLDDTEEAKVTLEANINLFFSIQSHRMNQVMKILTVVSTIFIPLTFIAGIYGMNFKYMPELEYQFSYFLIWIVFLVLFVGMMFYFKRKKWF
jgi:magnesium transporter